MTGCAFDPFNPRRILLAGAVVLSVVTSAAPASAQMVCGNHEAIEKRLAENYKEVRTGVGLAANGALLELYTSEKGTFTVVLTRPNGLSCLMAVGEAWNSIAHPGLVNDKSA